LHYAASLESFDACNLVNIFLEQGACPNVRNERDQSPLHLLCHNEELRNFGLFPDALHSMLFHGADPNIQSLTGCTPLHLSLYHKDTDSAVELVRYGADLHLCWKKPKRWLSFWDDMGCSEVLAVDMVVGVDDLYRILSAITKPPMWAPTRSWCMQCKMTLGARSRAMHCRHCSRLICGTCASSCLPADNFPKSFAVTQASWVCIICEQVLTSRKEALEQPTSRYDKPLTQASYANREDCKLLSLGEDKTTYEC
jgi:hypothetical protein